MKGLACRHYVGFDVGGGNGLIRQTPAVARADRATRMFVEFDKPSRVYAMRPAVR